MMMMMMLYSALTSTLVSKVLGLLIFVRRQPVSTREGCCDWVFITHRRSDVSKLHADASIRLMETDPVWGFTYQSKWSLFWNHTRLIPQELTWVMSGLQHSDLTKLWKIDNVKYISYYLLFSHISSLLFNSNEMLPSKLHQHLFMLVMLF